MYYIGFLKKDARHAMVFRSLKIPKATDYTYFVKVIGPYPTEQEANITLGNFKKVGWHDNPAVSERQRKFMCADLGRLRSGKKTQTGMNERQLRDFCRKRNPAHISESQIRRGTTHELEHTTDRAIARKIACDHLKEDPKYYTHLAKMEKMYKKNIMSAAKALKLTKKVIAHSRDIYKTYKENPGAGYHDRKFLQYIKELEKYKLGSPPYISTLAKAYEHLESAKESLREGVR
jgi:hypothetical protein